MKWLSFGSKSKTNKDELASFTIRQGKPVPIDNVFKAWSTGDLDKMLKAVNIKTNLIDRHFLLQSIVAESYKLRKTDKYKKICIKYSEIHLLEFAMIAPALKEDMGGMLPRVSTFQNYSTILYEKGEYEKAIEVCQKAISFGLHDGTQSDFKGRIERIKKKWNK
jgi:tetratricopeptide (TPR) repeat protein